VIAVAEPIVKARRSSKDRQIWIIEYILENKDGGKMRNTLTQLFSKLSDKIPRSSLHRTLKTLVDRGILVEESDEIESVNNQPMKIIRYAIHARYMEQATKLVSEYNEGRITTDPVKARSP
jgi:hypothetical protein